MACFLLGCLLAGSMVAVAQEGAKPADDAAVRLVLELSDGSQITGVPAIRELKLRMIMPIWIFR